MIINSKVLTPELCNFIITFVFEVLAELGFVKDSQRVVFPLLEIKLPFSWLVYETEYDVIL